jgi:hypothetical protein
MKMVIEINCDGAALHDDITGELPRILLNATGKIYEQLDRDGRCICEAPEAADKLLDSNGNTVGTVKVIKDSNLCPHDNIIGECSECDVQADLAYDAWREDKYR